MGRTLTEYLLTQHRCIHDRAWPRALLLDAEFDVFQIHHDGIDDGVFADGVGNGVVKDVREVVCLEGVVVDAGGNPTVVEDGVCDGGCVDEIDGVEDSLCHIVFVR